MVIKAHHHVGPGSGTHPARQWTPTGGGPWTHLIPCPPLRRDFQFRIANSCFPGTPTENKMAQDDVILLELPIGSIRQLLQTGVGVVMALRSARDSIGRPALN